MKTYEYNGFDNQGRSVRGLVEAASLKEAREKLSLSGVLAEKVVLSSKAIRLNSHERASVYRELSELISAGLTVDKGLDTMIAASESAIRGVFLARVRDGIREGGRLSSAFASASGSVSQFERAMIEAAEKTSALEIMLSRLGDFLEERDHLKEKVSTALIYPLLILTVGVCAAILMLGVLIPRMVESLGPDSVDLPWLTLFMMVSGSWVMHWGWILPVTAIIVLFYLIRRISEDEAFADTVDMFLFKVPVIGAGYRILVCQRFAKTMAILLDGGVSAIDSVVLSGRATGSRWIAGICARQADAVKHGLRLSEAIRKVPFLSDSVAEWIAVGEAAGGLSRMVARAGDRYSRLWDTYMARALGIIEPCILMIVGGFVLLVTLSVLLPIISLSRIAG